MDKKVSEKGSFFLLLIGFIIGSILVLILSNTMGITTIRNQVLDEVCKEIFGEEYLFYDNELMEENTLNCDNKLDIIQLSMPSGCENG